MQTIIFPASYYADAMPFISNEETRYYLQGVCVEPGGCFIATDGHSMLVQHCAEIKAPAQAIIIPADKKLISASRAKKGGVRRWMVVDRIAGAGLRVTIRIVEDGGMPDLADRHLWRILHTVETSLIDGTFPDWRRVIPQLDKPISRDPSPISPRLLARFSEVSNITGVTLQLNGEPGEPLLAILGGRPDAFGVVMPMRNDLPPWAEYPTWIAAPSEKKTAAA